MRPPSPFHQLKANSYHPTKTSALHNCPATFLHSLSRNFIPHTQYPYDTFIPAHGPFALFALHRLELCFRGINAFDLVQVCGIDGCSEEFNENGIWFGSIRDGIRVQ